jgi:hypothetical protein
MTKTFARPRTRARYWLVQRLRRNEWGGGTGFDALFRMDYMGSSEYEFGAIPKSLKRIRAAGHVVIREGRIHPDGAASRPVYFVGPAAGLDEKIGDFVPWFHDHDARSKERSLFRETVTDDLQGWDAGVIAWWSLEDDVAFTLDREIADLLLQGFARPKTT